MPRTSLLVLAALLAIATARPGLAAPARTELDYQLIEAAYGGLLPRVESLIAQGASVDAQDDHGYTALHWAAQAGWPLTTRALIARGATVNMRDKQGRTPLLLATVRKHVEVARVLVAAGADPQIKDAEGVSPMEYARSRRLTRLTALFAAAPSEPRLPVRPATPVPMAMPSLRPPSMTPRPMAHATPRPMAHATPRPMAHATPRPMIAHPATPRPHATAAPVARPTHAPIAHATAAPAGNVTLSPRFREEVARLYSHFTDHIGMRDPEHLTEKGFNQELEDKLEQIFHTLDYGSANSLARARLHDARAWTIAARKRMQAGGANDDKVCAQILESLEQLIAGAGF